MGGAAGVVKNKRIQPESQTIRGKQGPKAMRDNQKGNARRDNQGSTAIRDNRGFKAIGDNQGPTNDKIQPWFTINTTNQGLQATRDNQETPSAYKRIMAFCP